MKRSKKRTYPPPFESGEKVTLFRSVRPDELFELLSMGIVAHCNHCPVDPNSGDKSPSYDTKSKATLPPWFSCCKINDRQHINSGSKSKIKSRYISATKSEDIAAWWSSNTSGNPTPNKSATYIEFDDVYDASHMIDTITRNYGATANNRAKMSSEVLVLDRIPISNITNIYRVKEVKKSVFDTFDADDLLSRFRRIFSVVQGKPKYLLTWNIWSKTENGSKTKHRSETEYDLVYNRFPPVGPKVGRSQTGRFLGMIPERSVGIDTECSVLDSSIRDALIGQRIHKMFDDISYQGTVIGVIGNRYYVKYDDDDSEEMNKTEVETHLMNENHKRIRTSVSPMSKSRKRSRMSGGKRCTMKHRR
jgi:hypothetical protein